MPILKIEQVDIYKMYIPLHEPFVISLGKIENAENIIVVIRTNNGITGFGECSPYLSINGESIDTCFIVGQYLAKALKGQDPIDIKECSRRMNSTIFGNNSIKSAFDMALYDIASQYAGLPLYEFLGGKNDRSLFTDMTVSIGEPEKMAADALKYKDAGFTAIKVKLGQSKEEDVERIRQIRLAIGNDIPLRIDANQGWKVKTAIEILQALEEFKIQHCEEPIARWKFMKLKKVKDNSPIPIMADETCCDHHDAERLINLEACDSINIKLGKSGGLYNAKKIVEQADKIEMPMQVGGFMESRLGMTASAHLSLSSPNIHYCDFDTPLMFTADPVKGGIIYLPNGEVKTPVEPGLGASIDEAWLQKMEKVTI
ncbi:MAG: dipeptide epimerase [Chitinophagaceae bacterium]|jgi:L-alanine-DL-glutamate epimerase-like enolase superfamily enzyme|nr:dipeptide epimerase [Chitinophagaceae bacterium]